MKTKLCVYDRCVCLCEETIRINKTQYVDTRDNDLNRTDSST